MDWRSALQVHSRLARGLFTALASVRGSAVLVQHMNLVIIHPGQVIRCVAPLKFVLYASRLPEIWIWPEIRLAPQRTEDIANVICGFDT